jgi:hypothetical protein
LGLLGREKLIATSFETEWPSDYGPEADVHPRNNDRRQGVISE